TGSWKYLEYPEVNTAGSYLYEPAGSIHTLTVPAENEGMTDVWFAIYGANLNLDADGNVESVIDAGLVRDSYFALCEANGHPTPQVIGAERRGSSARRYAARAWSVAHERNAAISGARACASGTVAD